MYKSKIIKEKTAGNRTINGTDWPIVVEVLREQFDSQRPYWIVRSHCNGIGIDAEHFSTRRDALEAFGEER